MLLIGVQLPWALMTPLSFSLSLSLSLFLRYPLSVCADLVGYVILILLYCIMMMMMMMMMMTMPGQRGCIFAFL